VRPDFRRKLYPELLKLLGSANASQIQMGIIDAKIQNTILIFTKNEGMKNSVCKDFSLPIALGGGKTKDYR
jgi:hypothetical protein